MRAWVQLLEGDVVTEESLVFAFCFHMSWLLQNGVGREGLKAAAVQDKHFQFSSWLVLGFRE